MVNSDSPIRGLSGIRARIRHEMLRELARRLVAGRQTLEASTLEIRVAETSPDDVAAVESLATDFQMIFGTSLLHDYDDIASLSYLRDRLKAAEQAACSILRGEIRRSLNSVGKLPAPASLAARHVEGVIGASCFHEPLGALVSPLWSGLRDAARAHVEHLMEQESLHTADLRGFLDLGCTAKRNSLSVFFINSAENLVAHIHGFLMARSVAQNLDDEWLSALPNKLKSFEKDMEGRRAIERVVEAIERDLDWTSLRLALVSQPFSSFAERFDEHLETILNLTHSFRLADEAMPTRTMASSSLTCESYLYAKQFGTTLKRLGEQRDEADGAARFMFQKSCEHEVACSEILDEEVLGAFPRLKRENLLRTRLELRLSDEEYPLSVAHKEWAVNLARVTESAYS